MRPWFVIVAMLSALAAPDVTEAGNSQAKVLETRVGQLVMLKLPGNPRAGYRWQLNTGKSSGLERVSVDQVGWIMAPEGRSMFFSTPSTLNISITGKAPGVADLVFDYFRTWGETASARSTSVKVIVAPAKTARR